MKILVADDNTAFGILVTVLLNSHGYQVVVCETGLEAWAALETGGADLAVLDINMPGMNGLELLKKIRGDGRFSKMPVLMLTVRAQAEEQAQGYDVGADDYLPKPFSNEVLLARIRALERRTLEK